MSKIFFFRHAQASFMAENYDQLSTQGEKQSAQLGEYLVEKNLHFDKIFVGPLSRQKHTFEIVSEAYSKNKKSIPTAIEIQELKEHSGTEAMYTAFPKLKKSSPFIRKLLEEIEINPTLKKRNNLLAFQYFMQEWSLGKITIPDIESWKAFRIEAKKGLDKVIQNTGKGETIGVFTSGGTISSIVAESLNLREENQVANLNFSVRNTSFTSFLYSKKQLSLLSFNELPHLSDEMITFV